MTELKDAFYKACVLKRLPHTFLEFAGLMHEYIKICDTALKQDVDFVMEMPTHVRTSSMGPINMGYIGEKIECIFGEWFQNPETLKAFLAGSSLDQHVRIPERLGPGDVP